MTRTQVLVLPSLGGAVQSLFVQARLVGYGPHLIRKTDEGEIRVSPQEMVTVGNRLVPSRLCCYLVDGLCSAIVIIQTFSWRMSLILIKVTDNPSASGGYDIKISPQDPSSKSVRLVTEMMVMVGEGMGR